MLKQCPWEEFKCLANSLYEDKMISGIERSNTFHINFFSAMEVHTLD